MREIRWGGGFPGRSLAGLGLGLQFVSGVKDGAPRNMDAELLRQNPSAFLITDTWALLHVDLKVRESKLPRPPRRPGAYLRFSHGWQLDDRWHRAVDEIDVMIDGLAALESIAMPE